MLLFYVRHGDPNYSEDSLTDQGTKQAKALVERMKVCNPEKIFSSDSNRVVLTAKPTAEALGLDVELLSWCNENKAWSEFTCTRPDGEPTWYFSSSEYINLFNTEEIYKLGENWWQHPRFDGSSVKSGLDRIRKETDNFMKNLGYIRKDNGFVVEKSKYKRIALFAHQGFGMAFLSCLLNIPYPMFSTRFDLSHSSITVIEFGDNGFTVPKCLQVSNDSHIFASGTLKTRYQNRIEF